MSSTPSPDRTPRPPSIYDVAAAAGVATSTVSRALSKPGRVSFKTAEHVRRIAAELGYRSQTTERALPAVSTTLLTMVVADITNPVFFGLIRGAERTASHAGYQLVLGETQESQTRERQLVTALAHVSDGVILTSSRLPDSSIRTLAKMTPLVVLNRHVDQVASVVSDNVGAVKRAVDHLASCGHRSLSYLAGPEASWADGMRWRGLLEAGHELGLRVQRLGPCRPTMQGGRLAAEQWRQSPTTGVVAYNDLIAIGFVQGVGEAGLTVPRHVSVIGFDNIREGELVSPQLTTIAAPMASLGSAAVNHLLKTTRSPQDPAQTVVLPARLVVRGSTGPAP